MISEYNPSPSSTKTFAWVEGSKSKRDKKSTTPIRTWEPCDAIYINLLHKEHWENNTSALHTIKHELEHVERLAIMLVYGVDKAKWQRHKLRQIFPDDSEHGSGYEEMEDGSIRRFAWAEQLAEMHSELQVLASNSIEKGWGTREEPFSQRFLSTFCKVSTINRADETVVKLLCKRGAALTTGDPDAAAREFSSDEIQNMCNFYLDFDGHLREDIFERLGETACKDETFSIINSIAKSSSRDEAIELLSFMS